MKILWCTFILIMLPVFFTGCGKNTEYTNTSGISPVSTSVVQEVTCPDTPDGSIIVNYLGFTPAIETVPVQGVVKWENQDTIHHTVTGGSGGSQSNYFDMALAPGQTRCLRFRQTGNFTYFCNIHPAESGEVNVP